ncbi:MAG: hypothetical protein HC895_17820 [Leptolyngbyaceae cyanobacterium SM1_3_5]|nr:hypothetical protein [Leptolyngbyaceae cyanobacterium SM1_3_5]
MLRPHGVIGHPIAHSLSPVLHNAAIAHLAHRTIRSRRVSSPTSQTRSLN